MRLGREHTVSDRDNRQSDNPDPRSGVAKRRSDAASHDRLATANVAMGTLPDRERAMDDSAAPSLFFFTFHKCASVFFSRFVLQRARGFEHVDYAARMFVGEAAPLEGFASRGRLYGPLRLSAEGDVLERLVLPALDAVRRDDLRACLMIRDPRDMLVSLFFHNRDGSTLRPDLAGARKKEDERADAKRLGIDRYVLERAPRFLAGYERAVRVVMERPAAIILRYEDMVDDWSRFRDRLQTVFDLSEDSIRDIESGSRPNAVEQSGSHKRSGVTGDHRQKLAPETVAALTDQFAPALRQFGYLAP